MKSRGTWIFVAITGLALSCAVLMLKWYSGREHHFDPHILAASRQYGVDPALVKAVVWRESGFDNAAEGGAGELGLMQLREAAAGEWAAAAKVPRFAFDDLRNAHTNTLAGTWYLSRLLKRYAHTDDPVPYALADYNAGRTHVLRWNTGAAATNAAIFVDQITFPGTRRYIEAVKKRREHYRDDFK